MQKFIIGGGPHTGKTTLLEALRTQMPDDTHFIGEPANFIIRDELAKQEADPTYTALLPKHDYARFLKRVIAKSLELEGNIPTNTTITLQDRSLIDNVGYARYHEREDLIPSILPHVKAAGYTAILLCDFVGTYDQTKFRMGDEAYAHQMHDLLSVAYEQSGVPVINLPAVTTSRRVGIALEAIEAFSAIPSNPSNLL